MRKTAAEARLIERDNISMRSCYLSRAALNDYETPPKNKRISNIKFVCAIKIFSRKK